MTSFSPTRRAALAAAMAFGLAVSSTAARAQDGMGTLTVTFQGIKTKTGAVMLSLAASEDAYDGKAAATGAMIPATADSVSTTFKNLAPGRYAVKSFHDVDGDGKMSTNPFGIPTEPFAFSNNARGSMGPPKWADAAFEVKAGDNVQIINLD